MNILGDAFKIWKAHQKDEHKASSIVKAIFLRMHNAKSKDAFNIWRRNQTLQVAQDKQDSKAKEVENEGTQQERIDKSRIKIAQIQEKAKRDLGIQDEE